MKLHQNGVELNVLIPKNAAEKECTIDTYPCDDILSDVMVGQTLTNNAPSASPMMEPEPLSLEECLACEIPCDYAFPCSPYPLSGIYVVLTSRIGRCFETEELEELCKAGMVQECF